MSFGFIHLGGRVGEIVNVRLMTMTCMVRNCVLWIYSFGWAGGRNSEYQVNDNDVNDKRLSH